MKRLCYMLILALLGSPGCLKSQSIDYEFLVWAGGGVAGLHYAPAGGKSRPGSGFQAGIGYAYFPHEQWSIIAGLELASYNTGVHFSNDVTVTSPANDPVTGERIEWRVRAGGYEERQAAYMLNLPLKLHFQTPLARKFNFYTQAGMKIAFPMTTSYTVSSKTLTTTGYYLNTGIEIKDDPDKGFGTLTDWNQRGIFSIHMSYSATLEAGVKYVLSDDFRFYFGVYADYGFNNLKQQETSGNIFLYKAGALSSGRPGNSIVNVGAVTDHIHLMAVGFKVTLALSGTEEPLKIVRYYQCRCGQ